MLIGLIEEEEGYIYDPSINTYCVTPAHIHLGTSEPHRYNKINDGGYFMEAWPWPVNWAAVGDR